MSIEAVDKVLNQARYGTFVSIAFIDLGGDAHVAWGYIDQHGNHHKGVCWDYDDACIAASLYGFKLNQETPITV